MTLRELLASRRHVLLDFDGPVCAVFGGMPAHTVSERMAEQLRGHGIPVSDDQAATDDPFELLHLAATFDSEAARHAEAALRGLEVKAVDSAPMTAGLVPMLRALTATGHTVTIVSNNSDAAVRAFMTAHGLDAYTRGAVARTEPDPRLLKPAPHLVSTAVSQLAADPRDCVLVGDSTTDIQAAHAAGTAAIGYANKAGKRSRLTAVQPEAIVEDLAAIEAATIR
ncbi:HAD family hydrolase [Pseudonocardia sp. H11422]|uniref:HAD family hydrolase n=1 Tax=Pseudonocardia sp. H11422 TaxID=2835866 RepID=UPI001BDC54A2|nr:HAD-IIIA family hydrolase [Pseudonocardia sp. H11422]